VRDVLHRERTGLEIE
jgi:hypothetical protein